MTTADTVRIYPNVDKSARSICLRRIFLVTIMSIVIIIIYIQSWSNTTVLITQSKGNNTNFKNVSNQSNSLSLQGNFDVVLSYYSENVTHVVDFIKQLGNVSVLQKLNVRIILYNKNPRIDHAYLKVRTKADVIQTLPNLGREGGTFLYYIIENYDRLPDHILFSQAVAHGLYHDGWKDWFMQRLEKQFNSSVGYMPLVHDAAFGIYDCGERPNDPMHRLPELWGIIEQTICPPDKQFVAFSGQFLVSAKRIRNRPLRVYQYIYDLITANGAHWIHGDPRGPPLHSSPDDPKFGHTVERLWTTLFACTKIDMVERCARNECACYD